MPVNSEPDYGFICYRDVSGEKRSFVKIQFARQSFPILGMLPGCGTPAVCIDKGRINNDGHKDQGSKTVLTFVFLLVCRW